MYVPSETSTEYALRVNAGGGSRTSTRFIVSLVSVIPGGVPPSCIEVIYIVVSNYLLHYYHAKLNSL